MARMKFYVDLAGDVVSTYDTMSTTLRTVRVYVLSGDDKDIPPEIKRYFGGYKKYSGDWEKQMLLEVEPFSTSPAEAWNRGDRMMIQSTLGMPYTWVINSNLPEHLAFLMATSGFTSGEILHYGLTATYTPSAPWPCICSGWNASLDAANAIERLTITLDQRGGGS